MQVESTLLKRLSSSGWHREQLFSSRGNDACYSVTARRGADNRHPDMGSSKGKQVSVEAKGNRDKCSLKSPHVL